MLSNNRWLIAALGVGVVRLGLGLGCRFGVRVMCMACFYFATVLATVCVSSNSMVISNRMLMAV
jgi:hypothetical protein